MKITPDPEEFARRAAQGNLVPVWGEILADLETPVSAFRKLEDSPFAFLLESVEQGENLGRYSFLGCDPSAVIRVRGERIDVSRPGRPDETLERADPLEFLREFMAAYRPVRDPRLPPFTGGLVGYMGYDFVRRFERLPDANPDVLGVPDGVFMLADTILAFDHVRRRVLIVHDAHVAGEGAGAVEAAYARAVEKIRAMAARLRRRAPAVGADAGVEASSSPSVLPAAPPPPVEVRSNMTREEYAAAVAKAREYILAGDAFQIVLSQRFSRPFRCPPLDVYRALRAINPSPYMFYLQLEELRLAGSSPEILVTCKDGTVRVRPIAGTRRRGETREEDEALEHELLADPKERAEHIMLVDLGRNDVGRVCVPGTVRVNDMMTIERYSHVMHIVSDVTGTLSPGRDGFDALRAAFPAGTLSGAPKIRAMEIIDELENTRRGVYGGACGYFGFDGAVDTCITIRTVVLTDGMAHVQAGGGLVADSVPEDEYMETVNKAKAVVKAIEMAEEGLD